MGLKKQEQRLKALQQGNLKELLGKGTGYMLIIKGNTKMKLKEKEEEKLSWKAAFQKFWGCRCMDIISYLTDSLYLSIFLNMCSATISPTRNKEAKPIYAALSQSLV